MLAGYRYLEAIVVCSGNHGTKAACHLMKIPGEDNLCLLIRNGLAPMQST